MNSKTFFWSLLFSFFATSIICYVALVTMLGPWMGPMLALVSLVLLPYFGFSKQQMILVVSASSLGGIIATALSFSFPTLYFLAPGEFLNLLALPVDFFILIIGLVITAGFLGWFVAQKSVDSLVEKQQLAFPIGQLVYTIIDAQNEKKQTHHLLAGFLFSLLYGFFHFKMFFKKALIRQSMTLWNKSNVWYFVLPKVTLELTTLPLFISLGFIAGSLITLPLMIGTLAKIFIIDPLHLYYFTGLTSADFLFAFCSGIVLSGALSGLLIMPYQFYTLFIQWLSKAVKKEKMKIAFQLHHGLILILLFFFLSFYQFSFISQLYLVVATALCAYQISAIAGKIGLALLGRFATFVMVPGLFLFGYSPLQLTMVATFVELASGVAVETLFGYKAVALNNGNQKDLRLHQLMVIIFSAVSVSLVFYYLVTHFKLGSAQLFAQRAQARALLVQAAQFDYSVLACGLIFGWILKKIKMNPMLVLGGLLMPPALSLALIIGGIASWLVKSKEQYEPFFSGIYAGNAITILGSIFF